MTGGNLAFIGTVEQLHKTLGKHYSISIQTDSGTEQYEAENIGDTLLSLLIQYKKRGTVVYDIQVDRGSLEQHFMKIAKGN